MRRRPKSASRKPQLTLLGVLLLLGVGGYAVYAVGAPPEPSPSITAQPANPTNQTSATFTFADKDSGATFRCSLDGSGFNACTSLNAMSYPGPLPEGSHTFQVEAKSSSGQLSAPTSYTWSIDTQPPTLAVTFPVNNGFYSSGGWGGGCSGNATLCGTASDPSGVASVAVSIRQGSGYWWGGTSFNRTSEFFNPAKGTTSWSYGLALPPDGTYTAHVRATDALGNATAAGSYTTSTFTIDTIAPPTPAITQGPSDPTVATNASFAFTDSEASVSYQCQLDKSEWSACSNPASYTGLSASSHTFSVRAVDAAGNQSAAAQSTWTIVQQSGKAFSIAGAVSGSLYPGVTRSIPLVLTNPNNSTIYVTALTVTVTSSPAGCSSTSNIGLTQSNVSSSMPVQIPPNGSVTLPAQGVLAPTIRLLDLPLNQDACKNVSFPLSYAGSAHS